MKGEKKFFFIPDLVCDLGKLSYFTPDEDRPPDTSLHPHVLIVPGGCHFKNNDDNKKAPKYAHSLESCNLLCFVVHCWSAGLLPFTC